jgi:predicted DsbA family dithiol-disulfide isomerase
MTLIVYSDYICPYCYLGKVSIDKVEKEGAKVEWRPYLLHPDNPPEGIDLDTLLGDYNKVLWPGIKKLAKKYNLPFKQPLISANTQKVHEIAEYAKEEGFFNQFHDKVFHAYYAESINIGLIEPLLKIAKASGLSEKKCQEALSSGRFKNRVKKFYKEALGLGINAIPSIVAGKKIVSGMQSVEVLRRLSSLKKK